MNQSLAGTAIVVKPDTTPQEHVKCQRELGSRGGRTVYIVLLLLCAAGIGICVTSAWGTTAGGAGAVAMVALFLVVIVPGQLTVAKRKAFYRRWQSLDISYAFSDAGMSWTARDGAAQFGWSYVERMVETRDLYMLLLWNNGYVCIPKRNVPADQAEELSDLLRSHCAPVDLRLSS